MIAVSASKLSSADHLMRTLEIDVVALTEILVPRGHRAGIQKTYHTQADGR